MERGSKRAAEGPAGPPSGELLEEVSIKCRLLNTAQVEPGLAFATSITAL